MDLPHARKPSARLTPLLSRLGGGPLRNLSDHGIDNARSNSATLKNEKARCFELFLLLLALNQPVNAQEPLPAEKTHDLSPNTIFAMRISYGKAERM